VERTFRHSMSWLHTWTGVVLGALLIGIFWMGSLSVFDREIDRWMKPATRLALTEPVSLDAVAGVVRPQTEGAQQWYLMLPTEREPVMRFAVRKPGEPVVLRDIDPATLTVLPDAGTLAGTGFIFRFHVQLDSRLGEVGYWLVAFAGMAMLVLCVSGLIVHRRIFADFFHFRAASRPRRLVLDLHNLAGVLGLPFHVAITLSGLVIFFMILFPGVRDAAYQGDRLRFNREAFGIQPSAKANRPGGASASIDAMLAAATTLWQGDRANFVRLWHPGDANAQLEVRRSHDDNVTMNVDAAYFDTATGRLIRSESARPVLKAQRFISGLHFIQFRHWTLRWLYFLLGLLGCALMATGYLFWMESRRRRHVQLGLKGVDIVGGLTVGSVTGIVAATLAFFVANRLLLDGATFAGQDRASLEIWVFYLVWLVTFGHAWLRPDRAWREQCRAVAALAVAAVLLNWITTGDDLLRSLAYRHLWPVAGMDLMLLAGATVAAIVAVRLPAAAARCPGTSGSTATPE
jgi:uncharacterized iron-regulated membrane protein